MLADRFGARRVCQAGLALFVVASVGCGFAPSVPVLVVARVVQGVGAAMSVNQEQESLMQQGAAMVAAHLRGDHGD